MKNELGQETHNFQGTPDPMDALRELHRKDAKLLTQDLSPADTESQSVSQDEEYPRVIETVNNPLYY